MHLTNKIFVLLYEYKYFVILNINIKEKTIMNCTKCGQLLTPNNRYSKDYRFCRRCGDENTERIKFRREILKSLQDMNLESKVIQTKYLIKEAVYEFGIDHVYISYSGGKDSTVLSHIAKQLYPDILHIFANTTNEYPETIQHIKWEKEDNHTNIITVIPKDTYGKVWTFKRVVDTYGYPIFSKRISNAIRTYQHALSERTKQNAMEYIQRNFKKYLKYINLNISDKCCDKLKKEPIRRKANEVGMHCAILGILASESYQRQKDWIDNGCNVFYKRKDNQSRPLSFWTDEDISEYIHRYNVRIPKLYSIGYSRNGCMYCGFGVHLEPLPNRLQQLSKTHPMQYAYLINNFRDLLSECDIQI